MDRCAECMKEFEANNENSVEMRVLGSFYATVCKDCAERLKREGKIRIVKQGSIQL